MNLRECRGCGCTDDDACQMPDGTPCQWVGVDICSACVLDEIEADAGGVTFDPQTGLFLPGSVR